MCVCVRAHVWEVCVGISASNQVLNYEAFEWGAIVCYVSVEVLSFNSTHCSDMTGDDSQTCMCVQMGDGGVF